MRRIWMAVRAASVILVFAGGCAMIAGLDHEYEQESAAPSGGAGAGGGDAGLPCMTSDDCPLNTDCTTWACTEGACVVAVVPDGTPVAAGAVQGDCKKNVCQGGKPAVLNDDTDLVEDNDPCTTEMCNEGVKQSGPSPDGTACGDTGKLACANGLCEGCNMDPTNCNMPTECQSVQCLVNTCEYLITEGKVLDTGATGDCKAMVCDGMGVAVEGPYDADVPADNIGDCVVPACSDGVLGSMPAMKGDVCTVEPNGKCCGANCCANAMNGVNNFCDSNDMCCPSNKACNGVCCLNFTATCVNNACCETGNVCNNVCCPTNHACNNLGACCPQSSQCPNGTCCPDGQLCKPTNVCQP